MNKLFSTLAQLVERSPVKRRVPGSSPGGGAKNNIMGCGVMVAPQILNLLVLVRAQAPQ